VFFLVVIEEHTDIQSLFQTQKKTKETHELLALVNGNESVFFYVFLQIV